MMNTVREPHGYSIHHDVFSRSELASVVYALAQPAVVRTKAGARHVLSVPAVRALASDKRLMDLASQFVGANAVAFRATLFDKSAASNWLVVWHQDTALPLRNRVDDPAWGPWSTKAGVHYAHAPAWALDGVVALRVHLDDSTLDNGPLRVLPDTHRLGVMSDDQISHLVRTVVAVDCVAPAGGVVAMRPLTVHASSKSMNDKPRRVLHIEYAASLHPESTIELAVA